MNLRKLLEGAVSKINPFDNGTTLNDSIRSGLNMADEVIRIPRRIVDQLNPFDRGRTFSNPYGDPRPNRNGYLELKDIQRIQNINQATGRPLIKNARYVDYEHPYGRPKRPLRMMVPRPYIDSEGRPLSDIDLGA